MANILVMPGKGVAKSTTVNGRTYSGAAGTAVAVLDFDAAVLAANGWVAVCQTGPTSQRPVNPPPGTRFLDTTLGKIIVHEGANWRDPNTGAVV